MKLVWVQNEKGGIRKTSTAILIAERLRREGVPVNMADVDILSAQLISKWWPGSLRANPEITEQLGPLFETVFAGSIYVFDGGANTGSTFFEFFNEHRPDLGAVIAEKVKLTFVVPVTKDPKAQRSPSAYRRFFPTANFVMGRVRGEFGDFPDNPVTVPAGFETYPCFDIPLMSQALVDAMRRGKSLSYLATATEPEYAELRPFALEYIEMFNASLDPVLPHLLP